MADEKSAEQSDQLEPQGVTFFNTGFAQFTASAWLLQFVFGDTGRSPSGAAVELPRMVVGVPWPLAKVMHKILGETLRQFEDKEGEIKLPNSVAKQIETQLEAFRASSNKTA